MQHDWTAPWSKKGSVIKRAKPTHIHVTLEPTVTLKFEDALRLKEFLNKLNLEDVMEEIMFDNRKIAEVTRCGAQTFVKLERWARDELDYHNLLPWRK